MAGMNMTSISSANGQKEMERLFSHFDINGDGKISLFELQLLMRTIGEKLCPEEAEALLQYANSDEDILLGMGDFMRLAEMDTGEEENLVKEAFKLYEMDGKGYDIV